MNTSVLGAVFKRNFVSYFASPTGYVFICVFVLLSGVAAFWPNEFFNANLATLDQLNYWFPFIMLIFVPAITMSIWAEERKQGTDELLLSMPASDFDVVVGKYTAAVAIFTVALLFSAVTNFAVLEFLGEPDLGLVLGNYVGYWLVGVAMLGVGMVASFLTGNITVAYILGGLFNVPLVFAVASEVITTKGVALAVKKWSVGERFSDFGHGILSLSGAVYFLGIAAVALYVCVILIGRRHWVRGQGWEGQALQFVVRAVAAVVIVFAAVAIFQNHNVRLDATTEKLSSLSPETAELLAKLDPKRPVRIEAFISPSVPESYLQTRLNLETMLRELQARGGDKVVLQIHPTERFGDEAQRAEKRFNITPRRVVTTSRGAMAEDYIFMGVAMNCGLERVILPFIDRGIPVEYELVRSICTVTQQKRKKVGVLTTDAQLYGSFNMQSMSSSQNWPIIDELEKQYDVVQVDPASPITEKYDVLLAVQPSSLGQEQMDNFINAVKSGQPTAIFEDPLPLFARNVPGTNDPKRPPGGMNPMMMQQPPQQKGAIDPLWNALGINYAGDRVIWQDWNPIPKLSWLEPEFVFVGQGSGATPPFGSDPISSNLQQVLLPFPGTVSKLNVSAMQFTPLLFTGKRSGTVRTSDVIQMSPFGMGGGGLNPERQHEVGGMEYILAAKIHGRLPPNQMMADDKAPAAKPAAKAEAQPAAKADAKDAKTTGAEKKPEGPEINVVFVADIDMLHGEFFRLREMGSVPESGVQLDFDNVTFVLNTLDELAGDRRFIDIRKRRPMHRRLTKIDDATAEARKETATMRQQLQQKFEKTSRELEDEIKKQQQELTKKLEKEGANVNLAEIGQSVGLALQTAQRRRDAKIETLKQERDRQINEIETKLNNQIQAIQNQYKMWAVLLPPILPLLLALFVFLTRRSREREGVSRSRLR
jgi:ABC-2 type transport system permease protein